MTAVQKQNESDFCRCDRSASCPSKCVLPLTLAPAIHGEGDARGETEGVERAAHEREAKVALRVGVGAPITTRPIGRPPRPPPIGRG